VLCLGLVLRLSFDAAHTYRALLLARSVLVSTARTLDFLLAAPSPYAAGFLSCTGIALAQSHSLLSLCRHGWHPPILQPWPIHSLSAWQENPKSALWLRSDQPIRHRLLSSISSHQGEQHEGLIRKTPALPGRVATARAALRLAQLLHDGILSKPPDSIGHRLPSGLRSAPWRRAAPMAAFHPPRFPLRIHLPRACRPHPKASSRLSPQSLLLLSRCSGFVRFSCDASCVGWFSRFSTFLCECRARF